MRADEVALPFTAKEELHNSDESSAIVQRPITPIAVEELDALIAKGPVTHINGIRFVGELPVDPNDVPTRICCRCERLDLTCEKDRNKYADLIANATVSSSPLELGWEERVKEADKLVVYITYMEYIRVVEK